MSSVEFFVTEGVGVADILSGSTEVKPTSETIHVTESAQVDDGGGSSSGTTIVYPTTVRVLNPFNFVTIVRR
jgi:hypothetical protein